MLPVTLRRTARRTVRLSSNIMGHSPMSPADIVNPQSSHIPTVKEAEIGSVWQTSTWKRDKMGEIKTELPKGAESLEMAATPNEQLDIYLVDGIKAIVQSTREATEAQLLRDTVEALTVEKHPEQLHVVQYRDMLSSIQSSLLATLESTTSTNGLEHVRAFLDPADLPPAEVERVKVTPNPELEEAFGAATTRYRLQSTLAVVKILLEDWDALTARSDQEIDRAAVERQNSEPRSTLPRDLVFAIIQNSLVGPTSDRLDRFWDLVDTHGDGRLDEAQMNKVVDYTIRADQEAIQTLLQESQQVLAPAEPQGWLQKRRLRRQYARHQKLLQKTLQRHFDVELELPHRLRCLYAWANKAHQDNKMDSVVVEEESSSVATNVMGRKRYVELHPKISLAEFREVQVIHFPQIDHTASEFLKSFRDDILIEQGLGRQNRELMQDCGMFLAGVCVLDYIILSL